MTNKLGYTVFKAKKTEYILLYSGAENILPINYKKIQYHVWLVGGSDWVSVYFANGIEMTTLKSELEQYGSLNDYELFPIPDIRLLNQDKIKFKDSSDSLGSGRNYVFECLDKKGREYAVQYVNFLIDKMNFALLKHKDPHGLFAFEEWELVYSGTGNFSPALLKKHEYHVKITETKDLIFVYFIDGITMVTPASKTPAQPTPAETTPIEVTPVSTNQTGGADVPDFAEIGGGNVRYNNTDKADDGGIVYVFNASTSNLASDLENDYVEKYISLLTSKYNFVQVDYEEKKYMSKNLNKNRPTEIWYFRYTGSKNFKTLSHDCHLRITETRELDKKVVSFKIAIAPGLVFAGNYDPPKPPRPEGSKECIDCRGTGKCSTCGGNGYYSVGSDYNQPCGSCLTSGKCSICGGKGYK